MEVDTHIGAAMSGLIADARTLVDHARVEAQNHRFTYDEPMRVEALTQAVCDLALSFGEVRGKSRGGMGNGFLRRGFCRQRQWIVHQIFLQVVFFSFPPPL